MLASVTVAVTVPSTYAVTTPVLLAHITAMWCQLVSATPPEESAQDAPETVPDSKPLLGPSWTVNVEKDPDTAYANNPLYEEAWPVGSCTHAVNATCAEGKFE